MGLAGEIGSVEEGKKADLILINTNKPHLQPLNNEISAMAYSAQASDVDTVIVDGKILMENRKFTTLDVDKIMKNTKKCVEGLIRR